MLTVVPGAANADEPRRDGGSLIDELVREGARRMLAEALQAEVDDYIARFSAERDERGHRLVAVEVMETPDWIEQQWAELRPPRALRRTRMWVRVSSTN